MASSVPIGASDNGDESAETIAGASANSASLSDQANNPTISSPAPTELRGILAQEVSQTPDQSRVLSVSQESLLNTVIVNGAHGIPNSVNVAAAGVGPEQLLLRLGSGNALISVSDLGSGTETPLPNDDPHASVNVAPVGEVPANLPAQADILQPVISFRAASELVLAQLFRPPEGMETSLASGMTRLVLSPAFGSFGIALTALILWRRQASRRNSLPSELPEAARP